MTKEKTRNKSLFNRFLDVVERAGNKLPHPIVLFGLFALGVVVISGLLHAMGVSAEGELINSKTGEVEHTIVTIKSLFNTSGIVYMMTNAVKNFTGFAPLGTVLGRPAGPGGRPALPAVGGVPGKAHRPGQTLKIKFPLKMPRVKRRAFKSSNYLKEEELQIIRFRHEIGRAHV